MLSVKGFDLGNKMSIKMFSKIFTEAFMIVKRDAGFYVASNLTLSNSVKSNQIITINFHFFIVYGII